MTCDLAEVGCLFITAVVSIYGSSFLNIKNVLEQYTANGISSNSFYGSSE